MVLAFPNLECLGDFQMFTVLVGGINDHNMPTLDEN